MTTLLFIISKTVLALNLWSAPYELVKTEVLKTDESTQTLKHTVKDAMLAKPFIVYEKKGLSDTYNSALFILSGIHTEQASLDLLPLAPNVSLFSLDYQIPVDNNDLKKVSDTLSRMIPIQHEIISAYLWIDQLEHIKKNRISMINISFGSFIAPSALRALGMLGQFPYTTTFLFGGASLESFVTPHLAVLPPQVVPLIEHHLKNINPSQHLQFLKGPYLVINGVYDEIVPRASSESLINGLTGPKEVIWLPTPHISLERPDVIQMSIQQVIKWLYVNQAL